MHRGQRVAERTVQITVNAEANEHHQRQAEIKQDVLESRLADPALVNREHYSTIGEFFWRSGDFSSPPKGDARFAAEVGVRNLTTRPLNNHRVLGPNLTARFT